MTTPWTITDGALDTFLEDLRTEVGVACRKFPQPNPTLAAATEELGEVAKAMLEMTEGKHDDWWQIYNEAVQLAALAARIALEGDHVLGVIPTAENCA